MRERAFTREIGVTGVFVKQAVKAGQNVYVITPAPADVSMSSDAEVSAEQEESALNKNKNVNDKTEKDLFDYNQIEGKAAALRAMGNSKGESGC